MVFLPYATHDAACLSCFLKWCSSCLGQTSPNFCEIRLPRERGGRFLFGPSSSARETFLLLVDFPSAHIDYRGLSFLRFTDRASPLFIFPSVVFFFRVCSCMGSSFLSESEATHGVPVSFPLLIAPREILTAIHKLVRLPEMMFFFLS